MHSLVPGEILGTRLTITGLAGRSTTADQLIPCSLIPVRNSTVVELLRTVIVNVLDSLESGDSEGCGLRGNETEQKMGMGNG